MEEVCILIVAANPDVRRHCQEELTRMGANCSAVPSIRELVALLCEFPCQGIVIDVPTLIRSSQAEKEIARDLGEHFPLARIRFDAEKREIKTLLYGGGQITVTAFIGEKCRPFPPRLLRSSPRRALHLHALLYPSPQADSAQAERSVTINVSRHGCFFFSTREWPEPSLWITIPELTDSTPIEAEIRWRTGWGRGRRLPGIGVRFISLSATQQVELDHLLQEAGRPAAD